MLKRADHLGLRSAMADRMLPALVGAMSFLAVLAMAGTLAAAALAAQWQNDTGAALTVQVPAAESASADGKTSRVQAVLGLLLATPGVAAARRLSQDEVNQLLKPWFGDDLSQLALPMPAVITAVWSGPNPPEALRAALSAAAPGTLAETGAGWAARVAALTASLQECAAAVLLIVALVAAAVVAVATSAGLAQRRDAIEIIHGLGALDSYIAGRFAARATRLTAAGAAAGTLGALPVVLWLARLAAPFAGVMPQAPALPAALWLALPAVPVAAALIGWCSTQLTVRFWLRGLA
jgi:cell division transport system permease protein